MRPVGYGGGRVYVPSFTSSPIRLPQGPFVGPEWTGIEGGKLKTQEKTQNSRKKLKVREDFSMPEVIGLEIKEGTETLPPP